MFYPLVSVQNRPATFVNQKLNGENELQNKKFHLNFYFIYQVHSSGFYYC